MTTPEERALQFIDEHKSGVLGTLLEGQPYGSITPYVRDQNKIIIYVSNISQHFKNIEKDKRVSLTIYDSENPNIQANTRITILGQAEIIKDNYSLADLYFIKFPNAKGYSASHGFYFCEIEVSKAHFIEGFGKINWIDLS